MSYIKDVDCDVCKKRNTGFCEDCIHNYEDLPDLYEEIPEEVIKEREELELREFKELLKGEKLEIVLDDDFKRSFTLAHNFTSRDIHYPEFWCVYCGEGFLMACDTHALAKIKAEVPKGLVGKHLIDYDQEGIFTAKDPSPVFAGGYAQRLLDEARANAQIVRTVTKQSLDNFVLVGEYAGDASLILAKIQGGPVLNSGYLDRALAVIEEDEEFSIRYEADRNTRKAVLIEGKSIECVIFPVVVD